MNIEMDDGMIISSSGVAETWQYTGEVRWRQRPANIDMSAFPEESRAAIERLRPGDVIAVPPGLRLPSVINWPPVLQQRWVRLGAPGEEWRDVPTVEG